MIIRNSVPLCWMLLAALALSLPARLDCQLASYKQLPNSDHKQQTSSDSSRFNPAQVSLIATSDEAHKHNDINNEHVNFNYSQQQKFRVNVSNVCEKDRMQISIRVNRPFYGLIHAKDKRKKPGCVVEGNGDRAYVMHLTYSQLQTDPDFCGVVAHQSPARTSANNSNSQSSQQVLSLVLVIRMHKTIEFSEDKYFLLSCANRCSRPDCSNPTNPNSSPTNGQQDPRQNALLAPMATSESFVLPRFRSLGNNASADFGTGAGSARQISDPNWSQSNDLGAQSCDSILDLKFKWVSRLCWILTSLACLMLVVVIYLCLVVRGRQSKLGERKQLSHYIPSVETRYMSWQEPSSANSSSSSIQTATNSSYLASDNHPPSHQQQQEFNLGHQSQQAHANLNAAVQHSVIGRSFDTFGRAKRAPSRINEPTLIRRRRSIGSAMQQNPQDLDHNLAQSGQDVRPNLTKTLDDSVRTKSRSQITIHYEQGQDPFKASPFSGFVNGGYMSDSGANHRITADQIIDPYEIMSNINANDANTYTLVTSAPMKQAESSTRSDAFHRIDQHQFVPNCASAGQAASVQKPKAWTGTLRQAYISAEPQNITQSSQFDPQNSHQLIDLIQHKHRAQLAQANLTAATIQQNELLAELQNHQIRSHTGSGQVWR